MVCPILTVTAAEEEPVVYLSNYGFAKYSTITYATQYIGDASCNVDKASLDDSYMALMYIIEVTGAPVASFDVEFKWRGPGDTSDNISKQSHGAYPIGIHPDQTFILGGLRYVPGTYTITQAYVKNVVAA